MKKVFIFAAILFFCTSQGAAFADYYRKVFKDMDTNIDRRITWEEYRFYHPQAREPEFDEVDQNGDGNIELSEWAAFNAEEDPYYTPEKDESFWSLDGRDRLLTDPWPGFYDPWYDPLYPHGYPLGYPYWGNHIGLGLGFSFRP